jgi:hypothetical protein
MMQLKSRGLCRNIALTGERIESKRQGYYCTCMRSSIPLFQSGLISFDSLIALLSGTAAPSEPARPSGTHRRLTAFSPTLQTRSCLVPFRITRHFNILEVHVAARRAFPERTGGTRGVRSNRSRRLGNGHSWRSALAHIIRLSLRAQCGELGLKLTASLQHRLGRRLPETRSAGARGEVGGIERRIPACGSSTGLCRMHHCGARSDDRRAVVVPQATKHLRRPRHRIVQCWRGASVYGSTARHRSEAAGRCLSHCLRDIRP